ncbi:MAG: phosphoadenylyl-sulfate reductase [Flavobacteriales bacterium]|nr:phosphoadenylyl-sulfate reductase [Flavobacteriales bacterium]
MKSAIDKTLEILVSHKAAFSTSLGEEDQVLSWIIAEYNLPVDLFTLDTGRLFSESYDLLSRTQNKLKVNIEVFFPKSEGVQDYVKEYRINGFYNSLEARKNCCGVRKIEPLRRALSNYDLWVTGLRAAQSDNRENMPIYSYDEGFGIYKLNPLLHWSDMELQEAIETYKIPVNPLHKKGFVSIGCAPCTRAIQPGEHPRAGRWWWEESKKECGLHQTT